MSDFEVRARAQYTPRGSFGQFVASRLLPGAQAAANRGAQAVLAHALAIVHVRSGELRDSGHVVEASSEGGATTAHVVFDAPHAAYVEFGTGQRGEASPMAGKGPYKQDWPGMEPIPYLRPSLDFARQEVMSAFVSDLSLSLRG